MSTYRLKLMQERTCRHMKSRIYLGINILTLSWLIDNVSSFFHQKTPLPLIISAIPLLFYISTIVRNTNEQIPHKILSSKKYRHSLMVIMIVFSICAVYFIFVSRTMGLWKIFEAISMSLCWLWWCGELFKIVVVRFIKMDETQE